ncbi:threonyl-tRNA synthetase [Roseateles sp. YR242]|uniref:threonine--tRNA ligase n=1 Tax=Roseateles sp. YR242 TaxID=1855305 RepID=UPI0008B6C226|nr:threonine--tRNA ligase [Roseateles sp. YR242]SEL52547.1 threonyl-tRNA synthetase [Roseateles sp. YR242]
MIDNHEADREAFASDSEFYLHRLRHSAAHLMAHAISELFPLAQFGIGPAIKDGFYYDVLLDRTLTDTDLEAIETRMRAIAKSDLPIVYAEVPREKAIEMFKAAGQPFKLEIIDALTGPIGVYSQGDFFDLCKGPHVDRVGRLKHFKLLHVSGAYWRGDPKKPQLQRIYGTAFQTSAELTEYLTRLEQAKARDHRKLGRELGLYWFHEWAPGSAFWLPKGTVLYNVLANKMRELLVDAGYLEVKTPLMFHNDLWKTSGHWEHYKEDMFLITEKNDFLLQSVGESEPGEVVEPPDRLLALKPMNCPAHMLMFRSEKRSYRDLPIRFHDQGVLHRNEASGALSGLTRVRQFSQDDGHIFISEEGLAAEVESLIALVRRVYEKFGMTVEVALATRPEKYLGRLETWDKAEAALSAAITQNGFPLKLKPQDGTFYGPKIDYQVTDALGRQFQTATLQLDFQGPERFDLTYIGADNQEHRPVIIHRAIFGSFERFIAILVEHYAGAFPYWLAPVQAQIVTVSNRSVEAGQAAFQRLRAAGVRVVLDDSDGTVGAKVRGARLQKVPYILMIGEQEASNGTVSIRARGSEDVETVTLEEAAQRLAREAEFKL